MQHSRAWKMFNSAHPKHISRAAVDIEAARDFSSNVSKSEHRGSPDSEKISKSVAVHEESHLMAPTPSAKKKRDFNPKTFLATIGEGRKVLAHSRKQAIFTQGDASDAVFYIQEGKVRLTVVSKNGKEATLGILSEGAFFGEGGLAGQP